MVEVIRHPQDAFHFLEEVVEEGLVSRLKPLISKLTSIKPNTFKSKGAKIHTTRNGSYKVTGLSPSTLKLSASPAKNEQLVDCNNAKLTDGVLSGVERQTNANDVDNRIRCILCAHEFVHVSDAITHVGVQHSNRGHERLHLVRIRGMSYTYCTDCGVVLHDQLAYSMHRYTYHAESGTSGNQAAYQVREADYTVSSVPHQSSVYNEFQMKDKHTEQQPSSDDGYNVMHEGQGKGLCEGQAVSDNHDLSTMVGSTQSFCEDQQLVSDSQNGAQVECKQKAVCEVGLQAAEHCHNHSVSNTGDQAMNASGLQAESITLIQDQSRTEGQIKSQENDLTETSSKSQILSDIQDQTSSDRLIGYECKHHESIGHRSAGRPESPITEHQAQNVEKNYESIGHRSAGRSESPSIEHQAQNVEKNYESIGHRSAGRSESPITEHQAQNAEKNLHQDVWQPLTPTYDLHIQGPCGMCGTLSYQDYGRHVLLRHGEYLPSATGPSLMIEETKLTQWRHDDRAIQCSTCQKLLAFNATSFFKNHCCENFEEQYDGDKKVYFCKACHLHFDAEKPMKLHMLLTHIDTVVVRKSNDILGKVPKMCITASARGLCKLCNKKCRHLRKHMAKTHAMRGRKVQCSNAQNKTKQPQQKKKTNTENIVGSCEYCGKGFKRMSDLQPHRKKHEERDGKIPCDICGTHYATMIGLRVHKSQIHPKTEPIKYINGFYECNMCSWKCKKAKMPSSTSAQIKDHINTHTGETPHKCQVCNKSFTNINVLVTHRRIHDPKKHYKFTCDKDGCGKKFTQKCSLDRHLRSHDGIKQYKCDWCTEQYSQSYPLTKHVKYKHPQHYKDFISKDSRRIKRK